MRSAVALLAVALGVAVALGACVELPDALPEARFDAGDDGASAAGGVGGDPGAGGEGGVGGGGEWVVDAGPDPDAAPVPEPEVCNGRDDDLDDSVDEGVRNDCNECGPLPDEVCDGFDNDCDLVIDEAPECRCMPGVEEPCGTDVGPCTVGTRTCSVDGQWGPCSGIGPQSEVCNDVDDNCDGDTDEGVQNACGRCGPLPAEACNGDDDDCDGAVDEGDDLCPCPLGETRPCGSDEGLCQPGVQRCTAEGWVELCDGGVNPAQEQCSGEDEDCDGAVDEGACDCMPGEVGPCGTDEGTCRAGTRTCAADGRWGGCMGSIDPRPEACNGQDDDCDGEVDDLNCQCDFGAERPCGSDVGVCRFGTQTCGAAGWGACMGGVAGSDELCNGRDDDCMGDVDEDWPALDDPCAVGAGACRRTGRIACLEDGSGVRCTAQPGDPSNESCNGQDDDCDLRTDEGTGGGACQTGALGACAAGDRVCVGGQIECQQAVDPAPEVCNRQDDDCDGRNDEGTGGGPCDTGQPGRCAAGTEVCSPGGAVICVRNQNAVDEWCNGRDDDCDGVIDEDLAAEMACQTGLPGLCSLGTEVCVDGESVCVAPEPRVEVCNGLDDDCDGVVDNSTRGRVCQTGQPEPCHEGASTCRNGVAGCALQPSGEVEGSANPSSCNGIDDDCDGLIDEELWDEADCPQSVFYCLDGRRRICPDDPNPR